MRLTNLILFSLIMVLLNCGYARNHLREEEPNIDTSRFTLKSNGANFELLDNFLNKSVHILGKLLVNPINQEIEDHSYVATFNYSEKVTSFNVGNGFIGIHISSFASTSEGSSQYAAGRDIFLIYNPIKSCLLNGKLDFGISKERARFMGCLSAKTSHFILSDIDQDGLTDIGCIREELMCTGYYDSELDIDMMSGPVFYQDTVEWYIYRDNSWIPDLSYSNIWKNYTDLPLINMELTPVDFFGFMKWHTYDPRKWYKKRVVRFYPQYRKKLIYKEKHKSFDN